MTTWERLEAMERLEHVSIQQIAFYKELIGIQAMYREELEQEGVFPKPDRKQSLPLECDTGIPACECLPLISFDGIRIKEETIKNILGDVCNALVRHGLCKQEDVEPYRDADLDSLKAVMETPPAIDGLARFVFTTTNRIILEPIAYRLKDSLNDSKELTKYCPMCGSKPQMARLQKEDGKRFLQCSMCSAQWQFNRIKCVCCGSEDQDDLGFFRTDDTSPYRVDFCRKCKGYIKTIDERKVAEGKKLDIFIEDIATAYLDVLATEEGYQKNGGGEIPRCDFTDV